MVNRGEGHETGAGHDSDLRGLDPRARVGSAAAATLPLDQPVGGILMSDVDMRELRRAWELAYRTPGESATGPAEAYLAARLRVEPIPLRQLLETAVRVERLVNLYRTHSGILQHNERALGTLEALTRPVTPSEILLYLDDQFAAEYRVIRPSAPASQCVAQGCTNSAETFFRLCAAHKCALAECGNARRITINAGHETLCAPHALAQLNYDTQVES